MEFEDVKDSPADGIYVHGLYLEGCSWSKKEAHMIEAARGELGGVCGCVCARAREREGGRERGEEGGSEGGRYAGVQGQAMPAQEWVVA